MRDELDMLKIAERTRRRGPRQHKLPKRKTSRITWRDRFAKKIRIAHDAVGRGWERGLRDSLVHARAAGALLIQAKERMRHGYFMGWVKQQCGFSHATANIYMTVAENWVRIEADSERVQNLSLGALYRWLRPRAASRPLIEVTQTLLGTEERISKEYPALLRKLETVMGMTNRLRAVIPVLTEAEAQSTVTSLLTLRRHVDGVIVEVGQHIADFARTDVART